MKPARLKPDVAALLVAIAAVSVLAAGCSSSASTSGSASVGTTPTPTLTPTTSYTSHVPLATPASTSSLNITRTCRDLARIKRLNDEFNTPGRSLASGRALAGSLQRAADALVGNVADDIVDPARTFDSDLRVVRRYVDRATSLAQLGREAKADPRLAAAIEEVGRAESDLTGWAAANC